MENVIFNEECKNLLIKGANMAADAIKSTFGPNGTNVIIHSNNGIKITKDGATVANAVNSNNPYVNMGINIIKEISSKTADDIGDGSTTAAVLAQAIINEYRDIDNPIQLSRKLKEDCNNVISYLEKHKIQIKSKEDLFKVATLSANNDPIIGKLIADAFEKIGEDGIVNFQESYDTEDHIEFSEGYRVESGYASSYFINTNKNTCELLNPFIYISTTKLDDIKFIAAISNFAISHKRALLLIAPDFDSEIYIGLKNNKEILNSCCIKSPNFKKTRDVIIEDLISVMPECISDCKETVGKSNYIFTLYGCNKIIVKQSVTEFHGVTFKDISKKVIDIKDTLQNNCLSEYEIEFQQKRLANFTSGMATIYVGGNSSIEVKERLDRVEDAVRATRAAYEGILPGGGIALYNSAICGVSGSLTPIVKIPYNLLCNKEKIISEFWYGFNVKTNEFGNMYDMGIIEPFLVEKTALENAVSAASLILTCNCAILNFMNYGE